MKNPEPKELKATTFMLPKAVNRRAAYLALDLGITKSEIFRRAIDEYLEKAEGEMNGHVR